MQLDLILRDVRLPDAKPGDPAMDIGVAGGRIVAIAPRLEATAPEEAQGDGRVVSAARRSASRMARWSASRP